MDQLDNPFSQKTRLLYLYVFSCFGCGRSDRGLELHHITGRDSSSAFNACPLCKDCHVKVIHIQTEERRYFNINQHFLSSERYQPIEEDWQFLRDHEYLVVRNS